MAKACSIEECDRPMRARTLCIRHYQTAWKSGMLPPKIPLVSVNGCSVPGCEKPYDANGYCKMHVTRLRRTGTLQATPLEKRSSYRGDEVSYRGLHSRLTKKRGSAAGHACVDCGRRGAHWSYDNMDPHAKLSSEGFEYSLDLTRYEPRCVACHHAYDCRTSSSHRHDERFCYHTANAE